MDRTYIESQRIVQRYLSGDLTVREARAFEKYCLEHPDVLNSLPIPVRVKTKMARHPGSELDANDDTLPSNTAIEAAGLEDDDDENDDEVTGPKRGLPAESRRWVAILGLALILAVAGVVLLFIRSSDFEKQLITAQRAMKAVQMHAPASIQEYRVRPISAPPTAPTLSIGASAAPQLVDLRIDMSDGKYNTFLVTIDNVSAGRIMQIRRVARDSNGEMRLALNSSAFGAGDYDLKLEGYTWRGDTVPAGWIRLGMK